VTRVLVTVLMVCALTAGARADRIVTKSGQEYTGEIVEQNSTEVRFRTKVGNIITTLTLKRHEIKRIEPGALPEGFFPEANAATAPAPGTQGAGADDEDDETDDSTASTGTPEERYLRIPIEGAIGIDVFASGVDRALKHAQRKRIRRVVFDIDTPGGLVREAVDIANAITEHREAMRARGIDAEVYAYVRHAISAGIWVVFSCDRMFIVDGGTVGGAVVYTRSGGTGSAEVDAKMNSILAADVASLAEGHGYPAPVVKAMMIMSEECWAWPDASGRMTVSTEKPKDTAAQKQAWKVDGSSTVLTLKSDEAERLGIATVVRGGVESLGTPLGLAGWNSAGPAGESAMKWGATQGQKERARAEASAGELREVRSEIEMINDVLLPRAVEIAAAAHPTNGRYTVFRDTGQFTGESRQEWIRRSDEALSAWTDVQNGLKKLDKLDKRHKDLSGRSYFDRTKARFVAKDLERIISDLKRNRDRTSPP